MLLAERFGKWPWELAEADARQALPYLAVLGIEGEIASLTAGLPRDEPLHLYRADD